VAAGWPRRAPLRRAARWDGVCLKSYHQDRHDPLTLADFRECVAYLREQRPEGTSFDVVVSGETPADRRRGSQRVAPFATAGATWWMEEGLGYSLTELRARVRSGPPRV
jgi:hypothetical protein